MNELAFPTAGAEQLRIDLFQRRRKNRLHDLMADLADRLRRRPSIQFRGAAIPVGDDVVHAAHEDRVVRQVEESGLVAEPHFRRSALQDQNRRHPDRRGADQGVHDALGFLAVALQQDVAHQGQSRAAHGDEHDAEGAAEAGRHQHDGHVEARDRGFDRRKNVGDQDSERECGGRDRQER